MRTHPRVPTLRVFPPPPLPLPTMTPTIANSWQGSVRLRYEQRQGRTLALDPYAQAPLKLQKALYPEDPSICHSVLVHTAGGVVGGDGLQVVLRLETGSRALVTTAAASKIYRSLHAASMQTVEVHLAADACLEWFPQETICFNGANYRQSMRVDLGPGAVWLGWDICRFGRSARRETFSSGAWRSRIEVWQGSRPLWIDRQQLKGGSAALASPHGLGGHPVAATLALLGRSPEPQQLAAIRRAWSTGGPAEVGVTALQSGLLCRYRGPSSQQARRWFMQAWSILRPSYLGRAVCIPRVWAC